MSYSSTAVRFFTTPKQPGDTMDRLNNTSREGVEPKPLISSSQASGSGRRSASESSSASTSKSESPAAAPKKNSTFSNQDSLPKLPVPDLESSCKKYVEALYPLQLASERQETRAAVEDFLKTEGPTLQEKLKEYASSQTSYIEQFCESIV